MTVRFFAQLGHTLLLTWGTITLLFLLTRLLPNEEELLARFAPTEAAFSPSVEQLAAAREQTRHRLGLDLPLFYVSRAALSADGGWLQFRWHWNGATNQYHHWLRGLVRGDAGHSYRTGDPVSGMLRTALHYTVPLAVLAAALLIGLSVPLGMWLAAPGRKAALLVLYALDTLPLFVVALLLLLLLANPDMLALFPVYGLGAEDTVSFTAAPWVYLSYLTLPLASLVLTGITEPAVQLATALQAETNKEYVLVAQAKGLSVGQARRRHALRNALLPSITLLTDLLPNLLAGSLVVELVFAQPGLGRLLAEATAARDYPVLLGGVLVIIIVRQASLWLADGLYRLADPRLSTPRL